MTVHTLTRLFSPYPLGRVTLANRVVMAPMTRSRAVGNVPNALMATYYGQRADAGLIITEGTSPSPNGLGYSSIPGLYNDAHVAGWKLVTDAVHAKGGRIVVQLMHTGRIGHALNLPEGAEVVGPSAIVAPGEIWTNQQQMQPHPAPRALSTDEVKATVTEFVESARRAIEAGFDGVELHGANGYLIEQFLNPAANQRTDAYGGSAENRNRFLLEIAEATAAAIGGDRVGVRLSPYGANGGMGAFDGLDAQYAALASGLSALGLAYLHVVDHSAMGAPAVPAAIKATLREAFKGTYILSGNYDAATAERDLEAGLGDLVAFGRPFISNPDLVTKLQTGAALTPPDPATMYAGGEAGYTDYPVGQ
ncbi:MAG: alkene reductase [Candidatus Sericytochromatia bacterium]